MRCLISSTASSEPERLAINLTSHPLPNSAISTDTPGRIDKTAALQTLQSSGQSYDLARETLKGVRVDASGKVELEDWVEARLQ